MKSKFVVGTMVAAVAMFAGPLAFASSTSGVTSAMFVGPSAYSSMPASTPTLAKVAYSKTKMVSFSVRNDSKESISVKAGEKDMTLEPGKTVSVKLAEGTQIVATNTTTKFAAGSVISVVSTQLSDNTLVLR